MRLVLTTVRKKSDAVLLAKQLVAKKAAGCVVFLPAESVYVWKKKVAHEKEWLLLIKTRTETRVRSLLEKIHPYQLPAIMSLPAKANKTFEAWLR